jgi:two-component system, NtrC family, sensor kinase
MRLAPKLALALLAGVFVVVAIFTAWRVRGEMQAFDHDIRRDHRIIGLTAAAAVSKTRTREDAVRLVQRIDGSRENIQIRFVSLGANPDPTLTPLVAIGPDRAPAQGAWIQTEQRLVANGTASEHLATYVGAPVLDDLQGAVELAEPLTPRGAYISRGVSNVLASSVSMLLVCALIVAWIGARLVGTPVSELIGTVRRIGTGDFSAIGAVHRKDELGELARALHSMVTELEAARRRMSDESEARLRALDQLRHAERLATLGQLASVLAHEIGTPLNVIVGHAKLIATGKLAGNDVRESGSTIGAQCERMTQIVRCILDYARRKPPRRSWIHASDVVQQVCNLLSGLAQQRAVELVVHPSDDETKLFVDPGQLQQAIINLVMNAIQASCAGGIVRLAVTTAMRDGTTAREEYVVLSVSDQGYGIRPESQEHIFEPFFTTKSSGEGTGLGLSVARDIVREHGGFVEVSSRPGEGSTFQLYLPIRVDDASTNTRL